MPIIKHDDFGAPANGDTIVELDPNHMDGETGKAFKVDQGIWIIPNTQGDTSYDDMPTTESTVSIHDPDYCTTDEGKSKFLKQITTLLERIHTAPSGKNLLELSYTPHFQYNLTNPLNVVNAIVGKNAQQKSVHFAATVIIRACKTEKFYTETNDITLNNIEYSGTSTIYFNPEVASTTFRGPTRAPLRNSEIEIVDPSIILYHEMIHAVRNSFSLPFLGGNNNKLEEVITFGNPNEIERIDPNKTQLLKLKEEYKNKIKTFIDDINKARYGTQAKKIMAYKYMLKNVGTDTAPIYQYDDGNFNDLCDDLFHGGISELRFSQEINSPTRSRYFAGFGPPLEIDVTNPSIYTVEDGIIGSRLFKDNPDFKLHPKAQIFNPNEPEDYPGTTELFNYCGSRKRRDLESLRELPHCIPYPEDKDKKARVKRAAKSCADFIQEEFTPVYEKMKEYPNKLLGNLTDKNTNIKYKPSPKPTFKPVKELPELDIAISPTPVTDTIEIEGPISTIRTKPIGSARISTNMKRPTNQDILKAHEFSTNIEEHIDFVSKSNAIKLCTDCANKTYTHYPEIAEKANGALKGANKVANIAGIALYVKTLYDDFTDKTRPSRFHSKADNIVHLTRDILNIVPYVGVAFNIVVDISDKNKNIIEDLGIFILLEAFPELLPFVMIGGLIVGWIKEAERKAEKRDFIKKTIRNMLEQEDELLDLTAVEMEHTWANSIHQKTLLIAQSAVQQMQHNFEAIIHNAFVLLKKFNGTEKDKKDLQEKIDLLEENMEKHLDDVYHAICKTIFKGLRKGVVEQYKKNTSKFEATMNDATKDAISNILSENDPAIEEWFKTECLSTVDDFYKKHNIKDKLAKQVVELEKLLNAEEKRLQYGRLPAFSLVVGSDNKLNNISKKEIITTKNLLLTSNDMPDGEIHFSKSKNSILTISHHLFLQHKDFTLSFWFKIPLMSKDVEKTILLFGQHIFDAIITNPTNFINKWIHISYTHRCKHHKHDKHPCSVYLFDATSGLTIMSINNLNKHQFFKTLFDRLVRVGDFSISGLKYYHVALTKQEQEEVLNEEVPRDYIYDITGAPLRTDKNYILKSRALDNKKMISQAGTILLQEEQDVHKEIPHFYDRKGSIVQISSTDQNNKNIYIKRNDIISIWFDTRGYLNTLDSLGITDQTMEISGNQVKIDFDKKEYFTFIKNKNTMYSKIKPKDLLLTLQQEQKYQPIKIDSLKKGVVLATVKNNKVNGLITAPFIKNYKYETYTWDPEENKTIKILSDIVDVTVLSDLIKKNTMTYLKERYRTITTENFINSVEKSGIEGVPIPFKDIKEKAELIEYFVFDFCPVGNIPHDFFHEWDFNKKK